MNIKPHLAAATLLAGLLVGCADTGNRTSANQANTTNNTQVSQANTTSTTTATQAEGRGGGNETTVPSTMTDEHPVGGGPAMSDDSDDNSKHGQGMHHNMGSQGMRALEKLEGKEFDIAFMSQMIEHHQGAIDMSKQALEVAKRPETKKDAQMVIDEQSKEIGQMKSWLKSWYGVEPDPKHRQMMKDDMKDMMAMEIKDDKMFYEMMIPHHQGAIDMSQIVDHHSQKPELVELAKKIAADQKVEIQRFQQLANMDEE